MTAKNLGIKFENTTIENIYQWKGENISIKNRLSDKKLYKKSIDSLRKRQLMFIDQIIDTELKTLLKWDLIKTLNESSRKGPRPLWFKTI